MYNGKNVWMYRTIRSQATFYKAEGSTTKWKWVMFKYEHGLRYSLILPEMVSIFGVKYHYDNGYFTTTYRNIS